MIPRIKWCEQDISDMMTKHKSRLQKEKDAAEAARSADGSSPSVPSYMRSTAASRHAQASNVSVNSHYPRPTHH